MNDKAAGNSGEIEREPRTNLFVLATLCRGAVSTPVRVRNIGQQGALIEASSLPPIGTKVCLRRANLDVPARIIWSENGRAGLAFEERVAVSDWLPKNTANVRQQSVDRAVHQIKQGQLGQTSMDANPALEPSEVSAGDVEELLGELESLADDLASDAVLVERHGAKLQTLDLAAQVIRKLAKGAQPAPPP